MLANYFKIAVRIVLRHRLYSAINVFGLSLGIACAILILLFVGQEWSYDGFHRNANSLFRVISETRKPDGSAETIAYVPLPLAPALSAEEPGIERYARFCSGGAIISAGEKSFAETVQFTDPDVFTMFDFRFLSGDPATALRNPSDIVITEPVAVRYFGTRDAGGRTMTVQTRQATGSYTVAAVVRPMPANSSLQFDFLVNILRHDSYARLHEAWTFNNGSAFVQIAPGTSIDDLARKMPAFVNEHYAAELKLDRGEGRLSRDPDAFRIGFQPLKDIHLDSRIRSSPEETGNPAYAIILGAIGLFVLVIACINFTTLSLGRSAGRGREVGMRKVLGAVRGQLIRQFLGETLFLSLLALLAGIALAELALPEFNSLAGKQLSFGTAPGWLLPAGMAGLLLLAACIAGLYPALVMSRFTLAGSLKGKVPGGGGNLATRGLIVVQFGLSIFLIVCTVAVSRQLDLLTSRDLGYNGAQVLALTTYAGDRPGAAEDLIDRLRNATRGNPRIVSIAGTSGAFTQGYDMNAFNYHGENKLTYVYRIDEEYLGTLRIPLLEGRNFDRRRTADRERGMIVNEAFLREFGWKSPATGNRLEMEDKSFGGLEVIGVVNDFYFRSVREKVGPVLLFENPAWPLDNILVRVSPENMPATVAYLQGVWKELAPGKPFTCSFLDEDVQKQYLTEMKWGKIVTASSFFAVSLACLGLFGLVTLAVSRRTKEIGIRKVLGASATSIVTLVSRDFILLILLANLIAWPASYLVLRSWLESYASRIPLDAGLFLAAGGLALGISLLTIGVQVLRGALANPVESLKYE